MKKYINLWEYAGEILEQVGTAALVTTKAGDEVNTMTIGWGTLGVECSIWNGSHPTEGGN